MCPKKKEKTRIDVQEALMKSSWRFYYMNEPNEKIWTATWYDETRIRHNFGRYNTESKQYICNDITIHKPNKTQPKRAFNPILERGNFVQNVNLDASYSLSRTIWTL